MNNTHGTQNGPLRSEKLRIERTSDFVRHGRGSVRDDEMITDDYRGLDVGGVSGSSVRGVG